MRFLIQATERYPPELHLPHFTYNEDLSAAREHRLPDPKQEPSTIVHTPFDFSALFQPSEDDSSPVLSILRTTPPSVRREEAESFFIGFSWGPTTDTFPDATLAAPALAYYTSAPAPQTPAIAASELVTPMRGIGTISCASTLRRMRTAPRRAVSDREAMRQLVDCIGLSAHKKILASGRTPRRAFTQTKPKTLRFATRAPELLDFTQPGLGEAATGAGPSSRPDGDSSDPDGVAFALDVAVEDESDGASASDAPPSPSPSPRPGSAMSMLLRRSATPTGTLLSHPLPSEDTQSIGTMQHSEATTSVRTTSSPPPIYRCTAGDEDTLDVLEERHRALMGEIASIEGRVGAMKRRTG